MNDAPTKSFSEEILTLLHKGQLSAVKSERVVANYLIDMMTVFQRMLVVIESEK